MLCRGSTTKESEVLVFAVRTSGPRQGQRPASVPLTGHYSPVATNVLSETLEKREIGQPICKRGDALQECQPIITDGQIVVHNQHLVKELGYGWGYLLQRCQECGEPPVLLPSRQAIRSQKLPFGRQGKIFRTQGECLVKWSHNPYASGISVEHVRPRVSRDR